MFVDIVCIYIYIYIYYIKRVLAKGKQIYVKKIPAVHRSYKEDGRRKETRGAGPINIRGVLKEFKS